MRDFQSSLIFATVLCTLYLLLGIVIGYFIGRRDETAAAPGDSDVRRFRASMEQLARQVQRLSDLAQEESPHLSRPLSEGISGLVETVRQVQRSARTALPKSNKSRSTATVRKKRGDSALQPAELSHGALSGQRLDAEEPQCFAGLTSTVYDELTGSDVDSSLDEELLLVRRPYHATQYIAAWNGSLPRGCQYQEVECNDLSASGISFLAKELPSSPCVTITLGRDHELLMLAEVVNHQIRQRGRSFVYLIGCRFTKRFSDVPEENLPVTFQQV